MSAKWGTFVPDRWMQKHVETESTAYFKASRLALSAAPANSVCICGEGGGEWQSAS